MGKSFHRNEEEKGRHKALGSINVCVCVCVHTHKWGEEKRARQVVMKIVRKLCTTGFDDVCIKHSRDGYVLSREEQMHEEQTE